MKQVLNGLCGCVILFLFSYDLASQIVLSGKHIEALQKQYDNTFDKIEDVMRLYERKPQLLRGNKGTPGNKGREGSSGEKGSKGRKGSTGSKGMSKKDNSFWKNSSNILF